jgi:hypothetical protein
METAGLSDWSVVNSVDIPIVQSNVLPIHGQYSARIGPGVANGNRAWLSKNWTAAANTSYFFRGYFLFPSGSLGANQTGLKLGDNFGGQVFLMATVGPAGSVTGAALIDGTHMAAYANGACTLPLNTPVYIEYEVKIAATGGGGQLWCNGISVGSNYTLNTTNLEGPQTVDFGLTGWSSALNVGTYVYVDDFQINTAGPIGAYEGPAGQYHYLSPTGSDANNGATPATSWLTPNHPVNCGDVVVAASGTYSAANFGNGKWGAVTCTAGNNVAWLKCATFDSCKIPITSGTMDGIRVTASYWGVQGWEVDNTSTATNGGNCFVAVPATSSASIHHVVFANNVANVCSANGISFSPNGQAGVDYWAVVGNIIYGAGQTNTTCGSAVGAYEPVQSDAAAGTHIYVAGNFVYSSTNPSGCYDGSGISFDTFDGSQTGLALTYSQQAVADNNVVLSNGGPGIRLEYNIAGTGPNHSTIIARHNTLWNNDDGVYQIGNSPCGEFNIYKTVKTSLLLNIAATDQSGCYGATWNTAYAYFAYDLDGTSSFAQNVGWSATGGISDILTSPGFTIPSGSILVANPNFANPVTPPAPSCSTSSSVPGCMATVLANFTPKNTLVTGYGYQTPSLVQTYDTLFPQWLCSANLPAGLVSMGCLITP